ncbi:autophagy-related protein 2 homolog B isoform X5 [Cinclus cinclus]|uniref:autophagy-related protein 2 homolog B isoform X5 n=1 Tax=Cinclus cinclus TaxID=127875 RepID=UPI002E0F13E5
MPWPFSESIKKRACRYLLQRYLGHFLQEKLSLEQLSLDLYQGTGSLTQVPLDKWCLNEILESADAPLEVTDGFIQSISLSVPWGSLLQDNCALEVKGLEMVFRPRPRLASGSEPMYWSSFMTSSMQLAKECLSQKLTDEQGEGSQPFEGLEKFAETIETVLRRVKVTFLDTVLRIEHVPENSKSGTALEIRVERTMYCDETADECSGINVHQPTAFAHKLLQLSGVSFFWDEFPASAKSSPVCSATQLATEPKLSPSWNPKIIYEPHPQLTRNLPEITPSDPVQICKLIGRMELSLTLKQNEVLPGAKLDIDGQIDSVHLFLSPRQVHLLLDMVAAIAGPESLSRIDLSNKDRKNRPMQQEDEYRIQMELKRYLRKESLSAGASSEQSFYETESARTPSSREEEVFFSMAEMDMSHSLSSLPPLGDPPTMDLDLSLTSTYTTTPAGSPLSTTVLQPTWGDFLDRNKQELHPPRGSSLTANMVHQTSLRRTSIPSRSVSVDESRPELLFRLAVGTFSVSVLHIDPLPPPESSLNLNPLTPMARDFFARIEKIEPVKFSTEDFLSFREVFAEACSHDHLRFIGTGIKVSYEQRQRTASRSFSTDLSIGDMEFLECLFSTDSHSMQPHYTELLTFHSEERNDSHSIPCLQLHYKHLDNRGPQGSQGRLSSVPQKAELQIKLRPVFCELDISIVDRLNSLLQPQKLTTVEMMASHMYASYNKHISLHKAFTEVFLDDSHTPANCRVSVQVTAPALNLSVRFPIPDLRSDQERGPWFKKSLQKEILHLEFTDMEFKTEFIGGSTPEQVKLELTFKELTGSFEEDNAETPVKFFQVSGGTDGDITSSSDNFDWPRIVLKINPLAVHSILERIAAEEEEGDNNFQEEEEGGSHSLKDVCDIRRPEPSPFSSRRVMFENEEMVMPGDVVEMTEFQDKTISNSHYVLELMLPNIHLTLPNKSFYEKLYNRISNDLLLWEPTAPSPVETFENLSYGVGLSVASQLINTFSKDSFSQFKSAVHYDDESGSEEETLQYYSTVDPNYRSRRRKKLDSQNKNSQSFLSVLLNVTHGLVSVFTDVKQDDGNTLEGKYGEFWLEFNSGSLFSVTKYEGFEDRHYVCLHSSSLNLYHQGLVDGVVPSSEVRLPSTIRPHWLEPTICFSEEDGLSRTTSDGVGVESPSMLTVAVKIQSDKIESNTKEFLVAVGLRGATLQHRVLPSGLSWHEQEKEEEPVIKIMVDDAIIIKENHFSQPIKKTDTSKAPLHFPVPLVRYVVKEISLIWHLYGGRDFGTAPPTSPAKSFISPHSSPSHTPTRHGRNTACGGRGRNPDFLMEIQLSKVKFQHEVYPPGGAEGDSCLLEQPVSRQVFIVQDLEIRDRLATSQMNKFLYLYCSKEMPRKAHSNMLTVKALHVRPESGRSPQECCLRVSLMPLRLNIDQDALFFLKDFFTSLSTEVELLVTPDPEVKKSPGAEVTCSLPRHVSSLKEPSPVISFASHKQANENGSIDSMDVVNGDDDHFSQETTSYSDQPVFFREFRFTSEVPIRLDYHGKHVSMDQGTLAGILIGLAQLNCSELKLKRLCYRHGLLGVDKLFSYAISEWLNDIKKNQLPGILGGVGPMHSLVQLVQGLKDLVWLPIEQYRKDGRIVRGFQRGAASFGTSTAMAALELTNRMVQTIQAAAETAYDMVSPGPTFIEARKIKRFPRHRLAHQPVDLREGVAKAYSVVKEGITDTAQTIYETAAREHENRGVTGAVGGVLRQIPPTVVKPFIVATEATSNVLGGMRNQIRPDVRQEESQKWRLGED